jgi:hypothetical protein
MPAQPIEPVGTQQDEMNHQREHKQEYEERNQGSAWIEKKPNPPHFLISYTKPCFENCLKSKVALQPRPPLPHEKVRNDRYHRKYDEARHEDPVELFCFAFGQSR